MKIEILDEAQQDLIEGFQFYESRETGVGSYFLECLFSDIDSLLLCRGDSPNSLRVSSFAVQTFSVAIYYDIVGELIRVHAILDCRRNPAWIRKRLEG